MLFRTSLTSAIWGRSQKCDPEVRSKCDPEVRSRCSLGTAYRASLVGLLLVSSNKL